MRKQEQITVAHVAYQELVLNADFMARLAFSAKNRLAPHHRVVKDAHRDIQL